jgi:hypothetical protein
MATSVTKGGKKSVDDPDNMLRKTSLKHTQGTRKEESQMQVIFSDLIDQRSYCSLATITTRNMSRLSILIYPGLLRYMFPLFAFLRLGLSMAAHLLSLLSSLCFVLGVSI